MFKHLSPGRVMVITSLTPPPPPGLQYDYVSLSFNVLLNALCIDYIRHVLITKKNYICETKQVIDRCFWSSYV